MTAGAARRSPRPRAVQPPAGARRLLRRLAPLGAIGLGALVLGGCQVPTFGAFRGATAQAHDEFKLWFGMMIASIVVGGIVWLLIFWSIYRYRRKRNPDMPRQFHEHVPIEIIYTVLPIIIVLVIFYFTVVTENEIDATPGRANEIVNVLAYRWGWSFTYDDGANQPQGIHIQTSAEPQEERALPATSSEYPQLVLPEGVRTRIYLRSADVIHAFYVPAFNFNRQALPGHVNYFDFTPTQTGVFRGQCVQFCGLYHAEMLFSVRVLPQPAFHRWLVKTQAEQAAQSGTAS